MIKLRKLELKDADYMLEWMHDEETKEIFQNDFMSMTKENVESFIKNSFTSTGVHFAVVDDEDDEYLGTMSLKNIDMKNMSAEYAVSLRKKSRGKGVSSKATSLILEYAFNELKLHKVYLNVLTKNVRARKFYQKMGFQYEGTFKDHLFVNGEYCDLEWYSIINNEVEHE